MHEREGTAALGLMNLWIPEKRPGGDGRGPEGAAPPWKRELGESTPAPR